MAFLRRKNGIQFLMTTFMLRVTDFFIDNSKYSNQKGKKGGFKYNIQGGIHSLRFDTIWVKMRCLNSKVQTSYGLQLSWSIRFHNRVSIIKEAFLFFVDRTILANLDLCYCSFNLCFKKVMQSLYLVKKRMHLIFLMFYMKLQKHKILTYEHQSPQRIWQFTIASTQLHFVYFRDPRELWL